MLQKTSKPILVVGGTGVQGGNVARELLAHGYQVRVLSRNSQSNSAKAIAAKGAEVVQGDMSDIDSLAPAMEGVFAIFSAQYADPKDPSVEPRNAANMVEAAKRAGVEQVVHTSVAGSNIFPRWDKYQMIVNYNDHKYHIEEMIRNGGFRYWTILHPCWFMENLAGASAAIMAPELKNGVLFGTLKADTLIKLNCGEDTAKLARAAFEDPEKFAQKDVNVAGEEMSMAQIAQVLSNVLNKKVIYEEVSHDVAVQRGLLEGTVCGQEWMDEVFPSYGFDISETKQYGVSLKSFEAWVKEHRDEIVIN